jgi:fructosamine-3-kinase
VGFSLRCAVEAATGRRVLREHRVGGGDINEAYKVQFEDESFAFVKTRAGVAAGEYAAEAAGLGWLAEPGGLRVPEVLGSSDDVLVLDWVDEGARGDAAAFGTGLATIHAAGADDWGATPGVLRDDGGDAATSGAAPTGGGTAAGGGTPAGGVASGGAPAGSGAAARPPLRLARLALPNEPCASWPEFYARNRLAPLAAYAPSVEKVCERIHELAPDEAPSRLHGDLWSGNVLWGRDGRAWLIDPAAYGGHREVDLAMLQLFGNPGPHFFAAYEECFPLQPGREERVPLYQLFPLLVHAALFGGGYGASAERAARAYV